KGLLFSTVDDLIGATATERGKLLSLLSGPTSSLFYADASVLESQHNNNNNNSGVAASGLPDISDLELARIFQESGAGPDTYRYLKEFAMAGRRFGSLADLIRAIKSAHVNWAER